MKKIYLLIVLVSQFGFAQAPDIEWQKSLGGAAVDYSYSIQQTTDGGYIVAGETYSNDGDVSGNHGGQDYWVIKLNSTGSIQWQKCLGGTSGEIATTIQQTSDGGYIVAGITGSNDGDVSGFHAGNDYWIVKLNNIGTIQWQKTLGGTGDDNAWSIKQTTDGGYIVAGYSESINGNVTGNHGNGDCWVVKLNSTGTIQWKKAYGGTGSDIVQSIQQTNDGGYILAGSTSSNDGDVTGFHGDSDYWVVKLNSLGIIQWQKTYGGTGFDFAYSIQQTTDGGYIVAGYTQSNDGDVTGYHGGNGYDYWVMKINSIGAILWQKTYGGTGNDEARSIQQTIDGGYIIAGYSTSNDGDISVNHGGNDYWILKINSTGSILWQKALGGTLVEVAYSIQQTSDGGYIVAGTTSSNNGDVTGNHGGNGYDYWVVKLGSDALGTTTFAINSIKLYPNPTTTVLTVESVANLVFDKIVVTDLAGKIVLVHEQSCNQINVEKLATGMYLLQAFWGEQQFVSKFLKE